VESKGVKLLPFVQQARGFEGKKRINRRKRHIASTPFCATSSALSSPHLHDPAHPTREMRAFP
jgi:hypothetical protein